MGVRAINIAIDVDGSPLGYISWHNHLYNKSKIRILKPSLKNEKFGVQRMEMLAVYFAISDNLKVFKKLKKRKKTVIVRSDSMSTVELLNKKTGIRDDIIRRIYNSITRILEKVTCNLVFDHLDRTKNTAGKILEHIRKKIYIQKKDKSQ
jgi:Reverse transcriptase-like